MSNADLAPPLSEENLAGIDFDQLANQKVQLDIDDAPFLNEQAEEKLPVPSEEHSPAKLQKEQAEEEKPAKSKKKLLILGAGLVLILALAAAAYFFFFSAPKEVEPEIQPPIIIVPSEPELPPAPPVYSVNMAGFLVPLTDQEGKIHFLDVSFILQSGDASVQMEAEEKVLVLRDSIFYYLRNQRYEYMKDPTQLLKIRQEVLRAVNEYLLQGKFEEVLLDQYLIR